MFCWRGYKTGYSPWGARGSINSRTWYVRDVIPLWNLDGLKGRPLESNRTRTLHIFVWVRMVTPAFSGDKSDKDSMTLSLPRPRGISNASPEQCLPVLEVKVKAIISLLPLRLFFVYFFAILTRCSSSRAIFFFKIQFSIKLDQSSWRGPENTCDIYTCSEQIVHESFTPARVCTKVPL